MNKKRRIGKRTKLELSSLEDYPWVATTRSGRLYPGTMFIWRSSRIKELEQQANKRTNRSK